MTPTDPARIGGLIELPALAECLTLNKADFIRTGQRGAVWLAHRKAIQQAVSEQLARWGDEPDHAARAERRARPVERDLRRVLADLSDDFPLLATLVDRQPGGQRRLPFGRAGAGGVGPATAPTPPAVSEPSPGETPPAPAERRAPSAEPPATPPPEPALPGAGPKRPARYGLQIRFESRPDDESLARLVESTVWVNEAHPAWRRAVKSRAEGYHLALAVAMALAPLAVEPGEVHGFVTAFLRRWGEARA